MEIVSKEDGEILVEFPNENVVFNFLVERNKKQILFTDKSYVVEKPDINFKLISKLDKNKTRKGRSIFLLNKNLPNVRIRGAYCKSGFY